MIKRFIAALLTFSVLTLSVLECSELFGICEVCCPAAVVGDDYDCGTDSDKNSAVISENKIIVKPFISVISVTDNQLQPQTYSYTLRNLEPAQKVDNLELLHKYCILIV